MKKTILLILVSALLLPSFFSCGTAIEGDDKLTIVTTVFPEYDWVRQILGDADRDVELILLTKNGTDLHSYQPTVNDIATISNCDVLIYSGGASTAWIEDALALSSKQDRIVIRLLSLLPEDERLTEQSLHHNVEHDECDHHGHEHGDEYDEHVWLSLKCAVLFSKSICAALCEMLPQYEEVYKKNCNEYVAALSQLDSDFRRFLSTVSDRTLLFADRFPFSYLMNDYNINCYAAFPGCSSETEASFKTVIYLAEQVDALGLSSVVVLEHTDRRLAETVISSTAENSAQIVVMDSMQSVSRSDIENGTAYLDVMKNNLAALGVALNGSYEE